MIKCKFENDNRANLRHVSVDALVINNNQILLVKRAKHLINPNKYALPGGFLDRGETLKEAITREIEEETGYKCKKLTLFRINDDPQRKNEPRQNVEFTFLAEVGQKVKEPEDETSEALWFDLNNLPPEDKFAFDHYEGIKLYKRKLSLGSLDSFLQ